MFNRNLSELLCINKPLFLKKWLNHSITLVTVRNSVFNLLFAAEKSLSFKIFEDFLSTFFSSKTSIFFTGVFKHLAIKSNNSNTSQIMAVSNLKIIRVVSWSNLHSTSSIFWISVFIPIGMCSMSSFMPTISAAFQASSTVMDGLEMEMFE